MTCTCHFVPTEVLEDLSKDPRLPEDVRDALLRSARVDTLFRQLRTTTTRLNQLARPLAAQAFVQLAPTPAVTVYDCQSGTSMPGRPVSNPQNSADASARRAYERTKEVFDFFDQEFGRNSIDDAGMSLISSVHYGVNYANAMWNGMQMIYGDGDGQTFIDLTKGDDVIAHELTHGITQHSLRLRYSNEAGGLNESMSDVFGIMFRQWRAKETVKQSDWLIGGDVIAPPLKSAGVTCLRDMFNPSAAHALSPQPDHFSKFRPTMGPHTASGVPNRAFCLAATTIGGKSWEKTGKIWYQAMMGGASPNMRMSAFARRTRDAAKSLFGANSPEEQAVDGAWNTVGL